MISVVIPTYNRARLVDDCVSHTINNCGFPRTEIELIWVDDGSPNKEVHHVMQKLDPDITILKKQNEGTIRTKNIGLSVASNDFICVIDSDIKMQAGWLSHVNDYIINVPELHLICLSQFNMMQWAGPLQNIGDKGYKYHPMRVNLVTGAFGIHRHVLDTIGYLDLEFGFYGLNDAEWSTRAKKAGFTFGYIPEAVGTHKGGIGELGINRDKKDAALAVNKKILDRKIAEDRIFYNPFITPELNEVCDAHIREKK